MGLTLWEGFCMWPWTSCGKQTPVQSPPLSTENPCSLPLFQVVLLSSWNTVGYWLWDTSVSTSSLVAADLYICYQTHLMKECLTAVSSILAPKEWVLEHWTNVQNPILANLWRDPTWKLIMKSSDFSHFSVRFLLPISLCCDHLVHILFIA